MAAVTKLLIDQTPWSMDTLNTNSLRGLSLRRTLLRSGSPRAVFLRPRFRTLHTCEEHLFLRKLIRLSPVSNSVQYDIPAKDVIAQPVVSRPDAPLSLSRFQARQLFDIVPTRLVIRVLRKDIEKPVENAQKPGIAPGNGSCISLKCRCGEGSIDGRQWKRNVGTTSLAAFAAL